MEQSTSLNIYRLHTLYTSIQYTSLTIYNDPIRCSYIKSMNVNTLYLIPLYLYTFKPVDLLSNEFIIII